MEYFVNSCSGCCFWIESDCDCVAPVDIDSCIDRLDKLQVKFETLGNYEESK